MWSWCGRNVRLSEWYPGAKDLAVLLLCGGILAISAMVPPYREARFQVCLFHLLLGISGPGCGMTRAFLFLGHGEFAAALEMNPSSPLVYGMVLFFWVNSAMRVVSGRELNLTCSPKARHALYILSALLAAATWAHNVMWAR
jgi:hypothetical protein